MHVCDGSGSGAGADAVGRGADVVGVITVEPVAEGVGAAPDEPAPGLDCPSPDLSSSPFFFFLPFSDSDADGDAPADPRSAAEGLTSPPIGRALLAPVGEPSTESSATASGALAA